ncbi:glutathione S-transferase family protein [Sphingomonas corticis]|uniref:Glutathione S-transferase family protein n=1 Tax=Sphingomonas corticis TaxID=2722791 RepID=A0ABX1CQU4_9SPHN|nr:glutathione S-transferase family protein [Sphingomonas corticis]NJR80309.1 glutathione S-transferase family protein [Sphingomonas corticis]
MILIGQYDSPFVRRVAVAMRILDLDYEHRPWSTFSDVDALAAYNPLRRVPTLVLDDGEVLVDSAAILDHLDEIEGDGALIPPKGSGRRAVLRLAALAMGTCDKMVSMVYERALHEHVSDGWLERCRLQVGAVLDLLEAERASRSTPYWFGETVTHGDVAVACAMRFLREAHGATFDLARWPRLTGLADRCEGLEAFRTTVQPFIPPA